MRHRTLQPGQTRFTFVCRCGGRVSAVLATEGYDELLPVILEAHEGHTYELTEEAA